jgi:hypothetical protein
VTYLARWARQAFVFSIASQLLTDKMKYTAYGIFCQENIRLTQEYFTRMIHAHEAPDYDPGGREAKGHTSSNPGNDRSGQD